MIHSAVFLGFCAVAKALEYSSAGAPAEALEVCWKCKFGMAGIRDVEQRFDIAVKDLISFSSSISLNYSDINTPLPLVSLIRG